MCFRSSYCKQLQRLYRIHIKEIFIVNIGRDIRKLQERQTFYSKVGKRALQ